MSVIRGAGYILAHVPDMVLSCGTTQTTEATINSDSEYLAQAQRALRTYNDAQGYMPNQVYIGTREPEALRDIELPWYEKPCLDAGRYGKFGEIMPQDELLLLMRACDVFELVMIADSFIADALPRLSANPIIGEDIVSRVGDGVPISTIASLVSDRYGISTE